MTALPANCPLTLQEFESLPEPLRNSKTMVWVRDDRYPTTAELDAVLAHCERSVLPQLARFYYARLAAAPVASPTHLQNATAPVGVLEGAANGR